MANTWRGTDAWEGWHITTDHPASSYNQPVLVNPDGIAFGPGDIVRFDMFMGTAEAEQEYNLPTGTIRRDVHRNRFAPSERLKIGRDWVVSRQGIERIYKKNPK